MSTEHHFQLYPKLVQWVLCLFLLCNYPPTFIEPHSKPFDTKVLSSFTNPRVIWLSSFIYTNSIHFTRGRDHLSLTWHRHPLNSVWTKSSPVLEFVSLKSLSHSGIRQKRLLQFPRMADCNKILDFFYHASGLIMISYHLDLRVHLSWSAGSIWSGV